MAGAPQFMSSQEEAIAATRGVQILGAALGLSVVRWEVEQAT